MSRGVRWFLIGSGVACHAGRMRPGRIPIRRARAVAARGGGRLPQLGHGQGGRWPRPHLADRRPRHVRRGLSAEGLGAGRKLGAWLCRRAGASAGIDRGRKPLRRPSRAGRSRSSPIPRAPRARRNRPARRCRSSARSRIRSSRCSARRRPICRRRRIGSGPTGSLLTIRRPCAGPRRRGRSDRDRGAAALCTAGRGADWTAAIARPVPQPLPPLGPPRESQHSRRHAGRGQARGDAGLPDRVRARSLVRQRGAAGGAQVVQPAGGRDQADLGLFLPRHERPARRAYFRARLRQRARHRRLRAGRRPPHHGQGRLEGLAGGAGLSARRAGLGLRSVHHGAGAGLQPIPLRPHPRRPDAAGERPAHLPARRGGRRGGGVAGAQEPADTRHRGRSSRRRRAATIRRSSRTAIRSPGAATPAAAIRRTTGSIAARRPGIKDPAAEDLDWVEEPGPRPAIDWSSNRHKVY